MFNRIINSNEITLLSFNGRLLQIPHIKSKKKKERNEVNTDVCIILLMKAEYRRITNPTAQSYAPLQQHKQFLPFLPKSLSLN